jgi:WD40 repeat protein
MIPGRPDTLLNDPFGVAFSSQGELFVGNREGAVGGGHGSIARFTFDGAGNYLPNGNITGNGLEAMHSVTFSPTGELFAANLLNDQISRFVFDDSGNALPNGVITFGVGSQLIGLAFSPGGELFTTTYRDVSRYVFDADGNAIFNGSFTIPGETRLHGLAFSAAGELFVTSIDNNIVYRYLFDADGNPVSNGSFSVPTPVGLAFSPEGELFVSSHLQNHLISRFLFDASGNIIPNGTVDTPDSMGSVAVEPIGGTGGGAAIPPKVRMRRVALADIAGFAATTTGGTNTSAFSPWETVTPPGAPAPGGDRGNESPSRSPVAVSINTMIPNRAGVVQARMHSTTFLGAYRPASLVPFGDGLFWSEAFAAALD